MAVGPGSDGGSVGFDNADTSPGQRAIAEYRTGEQRLESAREVRLAIVEARASGRDAEIPELEHQLGRWYDRAERAFRKALNHDEGLFQAWSSLGYTLRRLGRYDEALAAYDKAIELEPRYAEAVEYRAEAYLQLGRLDEAKAEYVRLAGWVEPMAATLRLKMDDWYRAHSADPGSLDPAAVARFGQWLEEQRIQDGRPASATAAQRAAW
jgi:tetratricopeptide (TPR) repeat protein